MAAMIPTGALGISAAQGAMGLAFVATSSEGEFVTKGARTDRPLGIVIDKERTKDSDGNIFGEAVVKAAADNMWVDGVCVTEKAELLGQTVTLMISSADDNIEINGSVLATVLSIETYLNANGNLNLNKNAADVTADGRRLEGESGEIGIEAQGAVVGPSHGVLKTAVIGGTGRLHEFSAKVIPGDVDCEPMG